MKEIKIKLDYSHGPIWKEHYDLNSGSWLTDIPIIDNDAALQLLNDKAEELYTSLYTLDEDNILVFDEDKYESIKSSLLSLIQTIILRLNNINDGSFKICDEESSRLQKKVS